MVVPLMSTSDPVKDFMGSVDYRSWRAKTLATGGCAHPVKMSGGVAVHHAETGEVVSRFSGQHFAPCGNRRESVCVSCSDRYAADAFHLMRAGLSGGTKGIPVTVTERPRVFLTLTAPSFGPVHNRRTASGKALPCRCGRYHHEHDRLLGQPLNPAAYDYTGHVLWQAHAGELWSRFARTTRRQLAQAAGIPVRELADHVRLSYAKVAEYQRRGVIHFHAVIRLDGPDGPDTRPPSWATLDLLTAAIQAAHQAVEVTAPEVDGHQRRLAWGSQIDLRPITTAHAHQVEHDGAISEDRLASYVAKYATKGTSTSEAADRPIRSAAHIEALDISEHHKQIMRTAWSLGAPTPCPDCHPHGEHRATECSCTAREFCETCDNGGATPSALDTLNLRRWCHMLAFRGHFLSKSRAYSTTFKRIRGDRATYRHQALLGDLGLDPDTPTTVITSWAMTSIGHRSDAERELAEAIAHGQREQRQQRHQTERKD